MVRSGRMAWLSTCGRLTNKHSSSVGLNRLTLNLVFPFQIYNFSPHVLAHIVCMALEFIRQKLNNWWTQSEEDLSVPYHPPEGGEGPHAPVQVCHESVMSLRFRRSVDIPPANSFVTPEKCGYLQRLSGRGFLTSPSWKKRYCVLHGSRLYYYEKAESKGTEKSSGSINLEYYDTCEDATKKESRKASNAFIIYNSDKSHDGRHLFSADTLTEMAQWMHSIQKVLKNKRSLIKAPKSKEKHHLLTKELKNNERQKENNSKSPSMASEKELELLSTPRLDNITKYRPRGPKGRRLPQRKSMMPRMPTEDGFMKSTDNRAKSLSTDGLESVDRSSFRSTETRSQGSFDEEDDKLSAISRGSGSQHELAYKYSSSDDESLAAGISLGSLSSFDLNTVRRRDVDKASEIQHLYKQTSKTMQEAEIAKQEYNQLKQDCSDLLHKLQQAEKT